MPVVDDGSNTLVFASTKIECAWLPLLEKACAKAVGSYLNLRGGFAHEAMMMLTGCPTFMYDFNSFPVA